jgi:hypothetical protein
VVIPGIPHHVTQRGNRRARTFLELSLGAIATVTVSLVSG